MPVLTLKAYEWIGGIIMVVALGFGLWFGGETSGAHRIQAQWDAQKLAEKVQSLTTQQLTVHIDSVHTQQLITQTQLLLTQGATITKEIPVYVTPKADAACTVPVGFARVLNAAAGGQALDANPITGANDAALGTALSDVAGVVSYNLNQCRIDQERLRSLQGWVTDQLKAVNEKKPQ